MVLLYLVLVTAVVGEVMLLVLVIADVDIYISRLDTATYSVGHCCCL